MAPSGRGHAQSVPGSHCAQARRGACMHTLDSRGVLGTRVYSYIPENILTTRNLEKYVKWYDTVRAGRDTGGWHVWV